MRQPLGPEGLSVNIDEEAQDRRANADGFNMRDMGNVYHHNLKCKAYAADKSHDHLEAKELLRLIAEESQELAAMRRKHTNYKERQDFIAKSPRRRKINALYLKLGIASMLTLGDWSVNRDQEIPESMGVAPFAEIESMLLNFQYENGFIATQAPIREGKLVHLDLGCGNGVVANRLRQNETVYPFDNGRVLLNYWAEVGYADRIYWTLNDFLRVFIKDEYKDDPALNEFIDIVATLLMRIIHRRQKFGGDKAGGKREKIDALLEFPRNPNFISEVLLNLNSYIRNLSVEKLSKLGVIKADGEFLEDRDKPTSTACMALFEEFCRRDDAATKFWEQPTKPNSRIVFLKKYFKPELYEADGGLEKRIGETDRNLRQTDLELEKYSLELAALEKNKGDPDYERKRAATTAAAKDCRQKRSDLSHKRNELCAQRKTDLSEFITIYPHNIVLGDFEKFGDLFPEKQAFDFVHSKRATSHAQNAVYAAITGQVARRLKPGGIVIEDGKRESYTREERIDSLVALQKELGPEYRIGVIADEKGTKSVLMQRAITKPDGATVFFTDNYGDRLIRENHTYCPVEEFSTRWPEVIFRNWIIRRLKEIYIIKGTDPAETQSRVWNGRMQFKGLHAKVDKILQGHVFGTSQWQDKLKEADPSCPEYQDMLRRAWEHVRAEIDSVRRRIEIVMDGAVPIQPKRNKGFGPVSLRPNKTADDADSQIYKERRFLVKDMPRNKEVPDLAELEPERIQLVSLLRELKQKTGKLPLVVVEFDSCFTNPLLRRTLQTLIGEEDMEDLADIENVELRSGKYPPQRDGCVYIIGGSLNDAYDPSGRAFTENFSRPLVDSIQRNGAVRALGICFGHQSLVEAYGHAHGLPFETKRGSLEFGAFPVKFASSHLSVRHLAHQTCTVGMTRSGYTMVPGYQNVPDMKPLAYECGSVIEQGEMKADSEVPPVAFSLEQGRIVTCQFHPDVQMSNPYDRRILQRHLGRYHKLLQRSFSKPRLGKPALQDTTEKSGTNWQRTTVVPQVLNSPDRIFHNNIALDAADIADSRTPWVAREVGPAFLIPALTHLSRGLLQTLSK